MKIHEYQAKEILRQYGVATPAGRACFSVEEAVQAAEELGGDLWVVKAQIHAGGRGKGGGVKIARTPEEVREHAASILGMNLLTHQTGPGGRIVKRLLVEEGADIRDELYVGVVVDRSRQRVVMMASSEGGTEIEEVAANEPEKIHKVFVDPGSGLQEAEARELAAKIGIPEVALDEGARFMLALYQAFWETDASLAEINPLVVTSDERVLALDAKINLDDNAAFRHPERQELRDLDEEDPDEIEASRFGLSYIALDGSIGCLVNGAGLAMATMDIIKLYGSEPANFLDVGGGATTEQVTQAFKIMLHNPGLKAILVNIFGGIMRCDVVAEGLVNAAREVDLKVPLVVRLEGTNVERGREILGRSGIALITATTMADAAEKVSAAAGGDK
ncbi:MAG: ADP-forming succinate--CoA ligase subunit beta [Pseudomonadota bacterium]|nr:ADP-forming succinate--CoA ligase subunit beta [Pseudomonadota bacterium]